MKYVVDASVAANWYLPPPGEIWVEQSLHLLNEFTGGKVLFSVPDLFWPEIGNILWKAAGKGRIALESASDAIASIGELGIPTLPSQPLLADAFEIAVRYRCTVYDCIYVALAIESDRVLVTADERLANALPPQFPVRWIGALD